MALVSRIDIEGRVEACLLSPKRETGLEKAAANEPPHQRKNGDDQHHDHHLDEGEAGLIGIS